MIFLREKEHHWGTGSSIVFTTPSTVRDGDILLVCIGSLHTQGSISPGSGFSSVTSSGGSGVSPKLIWYERTWNTGNATTYTFSSLSGSCHGIMLTLGGVSSAGATTMFTAMTLTNQSSASGTTGSISGADLILMSAVGTSLVPPGHWEFFADEPELVPRPLVDAQGGAFSGSEDSEPFRVDAIWVPSTYSGSGPFNWDMIQPNIQGADTDNMAYAVVYALNASEPSVPSIPAITKRKSWQVLLANSSDLTIVDELARARDKQLTLTLNRPGSFSFSYNGLDRAASSIAPLSKCVILRRDGITRWSGPIWALDENLPGDEMKIQCVGWQAILDHRLIDPDDIPIEFVGADAGTIAFGLLEAANQQGTTWISAAAGQTSQPRTRSYKAYQNIGQEIQALSNIESGFDIEITPDTRLMNLYYPRLGTDRSATVHFSYKVGTNHNLASVGRQISTDKMVNRLHMIGDTGSIQQDNATSQSLYPLMEEQITLTGVKGDSANTLLTAYAQAEFLVRSQPFTVYSIVPMPWDPNNIKRVPRLFEDYVVGDIVKFSAKQGRFAVSGQNVRIFSVSISIDDLGNEALTALQTTY